MTPEQEQSVRGQGEAQAITQTVLGLMSNVSRQAGEIAVLQATVAELRAELEKKKK